MTRTAALPADFRDEREAGAVRLLHPSSPTARSTPPRATSLSLSKPTEPGASMAPASSLDCPMRCTPPVFPKKRPIGSIIAQMSERNSRSEILARFDFDLCEDALSGP